MALQNESTRWVCTCTYVLLLLQPYGYVNWFSFRAKAMFVLCIATAFIWGITNWFLKRGSAGLQRIQYDSRLKQFTAEIWYFFTNAQVHYQIFLIKINIFPLVLDSISIESTWFGTLLLQPGKNR